MYVCICNAIKETDLRRAARKSTGDAEAVYATLGKQPNCGTCLCEADAIVSEERQGATTCCKEFAI
ncbi:(2Fe-2S)-binding protein [Erythrobacter sp. HA6-11]